MADGWTVEATSDRAFLPVTLEEGKRQVRVVSSVEDALILTYIRNATTWAENHLGFYVCKRRVVARRHTWPQASDAICGSLGRPTIAEVAYATTDTTTVQLPTNRWHMLWGGNAHKTRLCAREGQTWPSHAALPDAIAVTLDVGVASAELVPDDIRQAVLLMVGEYYERRQDSANMAGVTGLGNHTAMTILSNYKTGM